MWLTATLIIITMNQERLNIMADVKVDFPRVKPISETVEEAKAKLGSSIDVSGKRQQLERTLGFRKAQQEFKSSVNIPQKKEEIREQVLLQKLILENSKLPAWMQRSPEQLREEAQKQIEKQTFGEPVPGWLRPHYHELRKTGKLSPQEIPGETKKN